MKPDELSNAVRAAYERHQRGDLSGAEAGYRHILEHHPDDANVLHLLGLALFQQGNAAAGSVAVRRAIAARPRESLFHFNLAVILGETKQMAEAEASLRQALALKPDYLDAVLGLANLLKGSGRAAEAAALCRRALQSGANAGSAALHHKLATLLQELGNWEAAVESYLQALRIAPGMADARLQLAHLLHTQGHVEQAVENYRQVLAVQPEHAMAHMYLGRALAALGRGEEAVGHARKAVALLPQHADAYRHLGAVLFEAGYRQEASDAYRQALALRPGDTVIQHLLDSLESVTTERASAEYVKVVFDEFAGRFEQDLQQGLGYDVPAQLRRLLEKNLPQARFDALLDIGCGTGLCGVAMRDVVGHLTGVDLSAKMLAQAQQKHIYHSLVEADVETYLQDCAADAFDVVVSADVFIYIGKLEHSFAHIARVLRAGGVFVYSAESTDAADYVLGATGRYRHHADYLRRLARQHGLHELDFSPTTIRSEFGKPVPGYIVLLRKPPA
ncbi:MAG: tetratricopeptide repeat protein [Pseudomonadota bacterium]